MRNALIVLAVLVAASIGYSLFYRHNLNEWEEKVQVTLEDARAWKAQAEVYRAQAEEALVRADSVQAVTIERVRVVRERVVEVREVEVPAIAQPFVAARDSIIDELLLVVAQKEEVIEGYVDVTEFLRRESALEAMRGDSLVTVLEDRPGDKKWWIPEAGVGPFAGICQGGGFCSGVGLTFSWRF